MGTGLGYRERVLVYAVALGVAILVVPLGGGQYRRLGAIRLVRLWMLFGALGIQILLELVDLPRARYDDIGLALLLTSYVLILGFALSNLLVTGMGVIAVGIAMNAFVIALNGTMPYAVPPGTRPETTVKHRPQRSDDLATALSDRIALGSPFGASISFGDLVIAVGLVDLCYRNSRRPRRSRRRTRHPSELGQVDLAAQERVLANRGNGARPDDDQLERVEHARVVDVTRA